MYNAFVEIDLDKTQEWLERTQQLGRTPAVRGGVAPDHRARRQTIGAVGLVAGILLALAMVPRPLPASQSLVSDARKILSTESPPLVAAVARPSPTPVLPRRDLIATPPTPSRANNQTQGRRRSLVAASGNPTDRIAPHAPIWIEMRPMRRDQPALAASAPPPTPANETLTPDLVSERQLP